jgi:hypothetical protein
MRKTKRVCRREETPEGQETRPKTTLNEKTPEVDEQVGTEVGAGDSTFEWHNLSQNDFKKEEDGESASETETQTDDSTGSDESLGENELEVIEDLIDSYGESGQEPYDEFGDSQDEDKEEGSL